MSNPLKGEADLGDRKLVVNFNNWCVAEAALGMEINDIAARFMTGRMGAFQIRILLRSFLVDGERMSLTEVGEFMDEVGLDAIDKALRKGFDSFFPEIKPSEELVAVTLLAMIPGAKMDTKARDLIGQLSRHWGLPEETPDPLLAE